MERDPAVYILASGFHGTLYIGVTSNLLQRIYQHREGTFGGFTADYGVKRLVWFETGGTMESAIAREKQLKNWRRDWKIALVEETNPTWRDLAEDFGFESLIKKVDPGSSPG
jgi:putative endonuclease